MLGSLPFNINDLPQCLLKSSIGIINDLPQCLLKPSIGMNVDDMVIYFSDSSPGLIKQVAQNDLNYVEQWLASNRLVLNQSKTKWMLFGITQKLEHSSENLSNSI